MKAYLLHGINDLRYQDIDIPKIPKGWVLVEVKAAGICGSDIPRIFETGTYYFPTIPGHEFSARVVEADENEYGIKSGMIVTANPYFNKSQIFSAASPAVPVFLISNFAYLR